MTTLPPEAPIMTKEQGMPMPPESAPETPAAKPEIDWQDRALRLAADLENMRRRTAQEIADARQYALTSFAKDLLPVADNFTRAVQSPEGNEKALRDGVLMVEKQLQSTFAKHGIAPISSVGQPLDPNLHQAIQQAPSTDHPAGHVMHELQLGYTLNGRLLRPAMVVTSTGADEQVSNQN